MASEKDKIDNLIAFVDEQLQEKSLVEYLRKNPKTYKVYHELKQEVWKDLSKELTGVSLSGSAIYSYLHPGI